MIYTFVFTIYHSVFSNLETSNLYSFPCQKKWKGEGVKILKIVKISIKFDYCIFFNNTNPNLIKSDSISWRNKTTQKDSWGVVPSQDPMNVDGCVGFPLISRSPFRQDFTFQFPVSHYIARIFPLSSPNNIHVRKKEEDISMKIVGMGTNNISQKFSFKAVLNLFSSIHHLKQLMFCTLFVPKCDLRLGQRSSEMEYREKKTTKIHQLP